MAKPSLDNIVQGLLAKGRAKPPKPLVLLAPKAAMPPATPLAELLGNPLPPLTEFEQALARADVLRSLEPRARPGPDPRMPWALRGQMEVKPLSQAPKHVPALTAQGQEKVLLHNALAKAKRGLRLTLKDRKLLGKWELARIMARVRPKGGDCG